MSTTRAAAMGMQRTDEELVALATAGDPESFNQLIVRWERSIFALAFRVLGREEDARDVCQETFLRAFRSIKGFKGQSKFSSWLYRIALNLCRDWIRRERRSATLTPLDESTEPASPAGAAPAETAEDHAVRQDLRRVITQAMSALSDDQRITIVLKEYHGLTFQEIADLQGCPLSTVKTRLYQGLAVLRRELQREGVHGATDVAWRQAPATGPRPRLVVVSGASRER
jgi:RNA polymerase sigma-70 factor (ECF subfamily)